MRSKILLTNIRPRLNDHAFASIIVLEEHFNFAFYWFRRSNIFIQHFLSKQTFSTEHLILTVSKVIDRRRTNVACMYNDKPMTILF